MKKLCVLSMLLIVCLLCAGCVPHPFQAVGTVHKPLLTYRVYVCGAVAKEGFVEVEAGSDFAALVEMAGVLPQTCMPTDSLKFADGKTKQLVVGWHDGTTIRSCVNVNGALVTSRMDVEGIDATVINRIADYILQHGKIIDKTVLQSVLQEDYSSNFYKFFVSVDDYEKAD